MNKNGTVGKTCSKCLSYERLCENRKLSHQCIETSYAALEGSTWVSRTQPAPGALRAGVLSLRTCPPPLEPYEQGSSHWEPARPRSPTKRDPLTVNVPEEPQLWTIWREREVCQQRYLLRDNVIRDKYWRSFWRSRSCVSAISWCGVVSCERGWMVFTVG